MPGRNARFAAKERRVGTGYKVRVRKIGLRRAGYQERVLLEEGVSQEVMLVLARQEDEQGPVANLLDL